MKKLASVLLVCVLLLTFGVCAIGSGEDETTVSQPSGTVSGTGEGGSVSNDNALGDYLVEIKDCRLAKDYEKKPVAIVTYLFTNQGNDTATSFMFAIEENVYQGGVGLNECYVLDDSYSMKEDNDTKEIKKGASIEVEVAYVLNDETTPIDVEVKEFISFSDKVITKQFTLQ